MCERERERERECLRARARECLRVWNVPQFVLDQPHQFTFFHFHSQWKDSDAVAKVDETRNFWESMILADIDHEV